MPIRSNARIPSSKASARCSPFQTMESTSPPHSEVLGPSYFRVFRFPQAAARSDGWHYALAMPGIFLRSRDGLTQFEYGPVLFERAQRHTALLARGDTLHVFYSRAQDCPEHILCATVDLRPNWREWKSVGAGLDPAAGDGLRRGRPAPGAVAEGGDSQTGPPAARPLYLPGRGARLSPLLDRGGEWHRNRRTPL